MPAKSRPARGGGSVARGGSGSDSFVGDRPAPPTGKMLYALDAVLPPGVTEIGKLIELSTTAVEAGQGHVLNTSHVIFPNGAVTLVLILAESHLAIHTWPEESLIAVDLFSCGAIDGERVLAELIGGLKLSGADVRRIERGA